MKALAAVSALVLFCAVRAALGDAAVDQIYIDGISAQTRMDYDAAIDCWNEALKINPQDATAYINRAAAYEGKSDPDKALADYSTALGINPQDPTARMHRAELYRNQWIDAITHGKDATELTDATDRAVEDYRACAIIGMKRTEEPAVWVKKQAADAEAAYNFHKAAACWWAVVTRIDEKDTKAWFRLALDEEQLQQLDKALADCDSLLKIDATNADAATLRAQIVAEKQAGPEKQMVSLTRNIRLKPGAPAYYDRLHAYHEMGDYDKAMADYNDATWLSLGKLDEGNDDLANIYTATGKWDKAIAIYNRMIENQPGNFDAYDMRAWAWMKKGEYAKAAADWATTIVQFKKEMKSERSAGREDDSADQSSSEADNAVICEFLVQRAEACTRAGMYAEARASLDQDLALDPKDTWGMHAKAWLLATCPEAKFRDGKAALKLAVEGEPDDTDTLAAAEAEAGRWDDAVKHEQKAISDAQAAIETETQRLKTLTHAVAAATADATTNEGQIRKDRGTIKAIESGIKSGNDDLQQYTARLALYQQKKPYRGMKELEVGD